MSRPIHHVHGEAGLQEPCGPPGTAVRCGQEIRSLAATPMDHHHGKGMPQVGRDLVLDVHRGFGDGAGLDPPASDPGPETALLTDHEWSVEWW